MRHIIDAIAAQGRGDDTELLHVTKGEMAGLDALARRHFGRELPRNPRTGLKEASLFQDWFGNDVGRIADVAVPTLAGAALTATGAGAPAGAALLGAGLGAANQGFGKGATTEGTLMGAVAGGMGAYGGANLAGGMTEAGTTQIADKTLAAAPETGMSPIAQAGSNLPTGGADIAAAAPTTGANGEVLIQSADKFGGMPQADYTKTVQAGLDKGLSNAQINANLTAQNASTMSKLGEGTSYLGTKDAISPALTTVTGGAMAAGIPGAPQNTTSTGPSVNKTLPKSEVYYTPTGERRTRIVAADGGLMSLDGAYGDYDGAEDDQGIRRYDFGGVVKSMQPGGAWGDATANLYGAVDQSAPWLKDITPGGAIGQLQPGRRDWEEKQAREKQDAENQKKEAAAAAAKAQQQADFQNQWQDRYGIPSAAAGGMTPMPERIGIANVGFAKGRYLQGPGDGMSDSIPANIDGKQEARLATGEFVVPADVVSGLGNGDSNAGAKQLHAMMDRTRQARTGTKKQGKQINPRKVMPA